MYRSVPGAVSGREASLATDAPKRNVFARAQGSFAKYGVRMSVSRVCDYHSYSPHAQLHNEYLTLDEFDPPLSQECAVIAPIGPPCQNLATPREDLEYGT